jgi:DMSO/TMAO reductase YedYZ molybdopterin-dependent catalytic subunit
VPERPAVIIPGRRPGQDGYDRRGFLHAAGAVGTLGVAGAFAWRSFSLEPGFDSRLAVRAPRPDSAAGAATGADFEIPRLTPYFTPTKDFYRVDTSIIVPRVDARKWRLRIHGMVENPIELSYADLMGRKLIERDITLTCVSNEIGGDLAGNARWVGARIDEVLREARPLPAANAVKSTSVDGWTAGTPLSALTDGRDALFAMTMNGEPLTYDHGFPVRMVVPGLYGYVSATKWVKDIEVTRFDRFQAYWTQRGWSAQGPIKTATRVDLPVPFKDTPAGRTVVAGVAWAQHRGISKVEVQIDGEPWRVAELSPWNNVDTWRQWRLEVDLKKGTRNITARAYDGAGVLQTDKNAPSLPDGATGYHNALVYAV